MAAYGVSSHWPRLRTLCGSQKVTVAAMQMADMKVWRSGRNGCGCDASPLQLAQGRLELVEHVLDLVPLAVEDCVVGYWHLAACL